MSKCNTLTNSTECTNNDTCIWNYNNNKKCTNKYYCGLSGCTTDKTKTDDPNIYSFTKDKCINNCNQKSCYIKDKDTEYAFNYLQCLKNNPDIKKIQNSNQKQCNILNDETDNCKTEQLCTSFDKGSDHQKQCKNIAYTYLTNGWAKVQQYLNSVTDDDKKQDIIKALLCRIATSVYNPNKGSRPADLYVWYMNNMLGSSWQIILYIFSIVFFIIFFILFVIKTINGLFNLLTRKSTGSCTKYIYYIIGIILLCFVTIPYLFGMISNYFILNSGVINNYQDTTNLSDYFSNLTKGGFLFFGIIGLGLILYLIFGNKGIVYKTYFGSNKKFLLLIILLILGIWIPIFYFGVFTILLPPILLILSLLQKIMDTTFGISEKKLNELKTQTQKGNLSLKIFTNIIIKLGIITFLGSSYLFMQNSISNLQRVQEDSSSNTWKAKLSRMLTIGSDYGWYIYGFILFVLIWIMLKNCSSKKSVIIILSLFFLFIIIPVVASFINNYSNIKSPNSITTISFFGFIAFILLIVQFIFVLIQYTSVLYDDTVYSTNNFSSFFLFKGWAPFGWSSVVYIINLIISKMTSKITSGLDTKSYSGIFNILKGVNL